MKLLLVVGARPNFMKIAPIDRECQSRGIETILVHTGQHYDENMSDVFFQDLNMRRPDIHLNIGSASHSVQTAKILIEFEKVCIAEQPSMVVVVGDVNSTIACTLVAKKMNIPVAHVEAGLRSGDMSMPEEINRLMTDCVADLLLTPSQDADINLKNEGIASNRIQFVGNIMIDSLLDAIGRCGMVAEERFGLSGDYALLTLHRPSNVDTKESLEPLIQTMHEIAKSTPILFPVHPRTRIRLENFGLMDYLSSQHGIHISEPLGYLEFISVMSKSKIVLTDSGGLQEETTALGLPCLTLRENTERPITIHEGTNQLVGTSKERILSAYKEIKERNFSTTGRIPKYWDGQTSSRIINSIVGYLDE